jgi:hypothetical protein
MTAGVEEHQEAAVPAAEAAPAGRLVRGLAWLGHFHGVNN